MNCVGHCIGKTPFSYPGVGVGELTQPFAFTWRLQCQNLFVYKIQFVLSQKRNVCTWQEKYITVQDFYTYLKYEEYSRSVALYISCSKCLKLM